MRIMSSAKCALGVTSVVAILAGCSSSTVAPGAPTMSANVAAGRSYARYAQMKPSPLGNLASLIPGLRPRGPMRLLGRVAPDIEKNNIYVSSFGANPDVLGYQSTQRRNKPPICTSPIIASEVNSIAVDGVGNLMVPDGSNKTIVIGQGPGMCGPQAASIADPYGQPADASSPNALTGKIAVGNIADNGLTPGSISICSVSAGCTANLTNPAISVLAGVAMDNRGNCWASAVDKNDVGDLTYFKGCAGKGVQATGFVNLLYGSIDIDASGNLVTVDGNNGAGTAAVNVYSGCKPTCKLLSSTPLIDYTTCARLNQSNTRLVVADPNNNQVEIYSYSAAGGVTYLYSFNNGFSSGYDPQGVAYNPRTRQ